MAQDFTPAWIVFIAVSTIVTVIFQWGFYPSIKEKITSWKEECIKKQEEIEKKEQMAIEKKKQEYSRAIREQNMREQNDKFHRRA